MRQHVTVGTSELAQEWGRPEIIETFWVKQGIPILSAILVLVAITLIGWFSRYLFGKWLIDLMEGVIKKVPVIKSIYASVKEIVARFGEDSKKNFKQVVLVRFPHAGAWTVGFLTNSEPSELSEKLGTPLLHIFVPTTPNPTGGYFLLFREEDVIRISMSVSDAMKLVISGGALLPKRDAAASADAPPSALPDAFPPSAAPSPPSPPEPEARGA
ncbi:MAG: DUF502 domain-containing protein [Puniceicoccales bacterium]|nr:DUF502 domain-containing protein [Puniceicoccales bacterium]